MNMGTPLSLLEGLERFSLVHRHLYETINVDQTLIEISFELGNRLKSLIIGLYPITDSAIEAISAHCPNLEELQTMFYEVYVFDSRLDPTKGGRSKITQKSAAAISNLKKLHTLNLSLSLITDNGIKQILANCHLIRKLYLNCCHNLTAASLKAFQRFANQQPLEIHLISVKNCKLLNLKKLNNFGNGNGTSKQNIVTLC